MVYNFGIYEDGNHRARIGDKHTKEYLVWHSMISRCYNPNYHGVKSYEDVEVCDDWRYFQKFADWFNKNYYTIDNEVIVLEKDYKTFAYGLEKNYSCDNCMFVPQALNKTITFRHNVTCDLPVGVKYLKYGKKHYSFDQGFERQQDKNYIYKTFDTKEEAYESYLKSVYKRLEHYIDKYDGKIPNDNIKAIRDFIKNDTLREMHKMQTIRFK